MASTLQSLLGGEPHVEQIVTGFAAADGPVFSRRGYLLFTDLPARRIMKWEDGRLTAYCTDSNAAQALTFDHEGRLLACEAGRVTRTEKDGTITVLESTSDQAVDIVYAIDGSIYFTHNTGVHQITPKSTLRSVSRNANQLHGIALAPNQQRLYVSDAGSRAIQVHDIRPDGSLAPASRFTSVFDAPAGLKTDEEGNIWIAGGDGISVFNAAGAYLGTIGIPEKPSNCTWGEGFRDLYVTAQTSIYKIATKIVGTRTY